MTESPSQLDQIVEEGGIGPSRPLTDHLRDGKNWLNGGNCCGQKDNSGTCAAPACIFGDALKWFFEAADEIDRQASLRHGSQRELQDEIDRRDDIINSDRIVIADIVDQNCSLRVQLASMRITLRMISAIADTHGRRIETAMDGCDTIMELCKVKATEAPDMSREATTKPEPNISHEDRVLGMMKEDAAKIIERLKAPPRRTHDGSGKRIDGHGDPAKGEYNAFLGDDGSDIPCD